MKKCPGCEEELGAAYWYQKEGLHVATTLNDKNYPDTKKHYLILMVDDKGDIKVS